MSVKEILSLSLNRLQKKKTLPNEQPGRTHGMCIMACCFFVLVPYATLALLEVEVANLNLSFPVA